jgi:hypothetical protein
MKLIERNALRCIIKNYDERHLHEALGPALLLLLKRGEVRADLDRSPYTFGGDGSPDEVVPRIFMAHVHAAVDIVETFDDLMAKRAEVQSRRLVGDAEIIERFGRPLNPLLHEGSYLEAQHRLVQGLNLDEAYRRERAAQVVFVADADGRSADRVLTIAGAVGRVVDSVIAWRGAVAPEVEAVRVLPYSDEETLLRITDAAEIVVIPAAELVRFEEVERTLAVLVVDLAGAEALDDATLNEALDAGDYFLCEAEQRRDFWLGLLRARGRLSPGGPDALAPELVGFLSTERAGERDLGVLRELLLAPWRWRVARERGRPYRSVTDDVRLLLDLRNAEVSSRDAELDKRAVLVDDVNAKLEAHIRDLGSARQEIRVLRDEARELRRSRDELLAVVNHQAKRLALLRRTPVYPLYRALRQATRRALGRGGP